MTFRPRPTPAPVPPKRSSPYWNNRKAGILSQGGRPSIVGKTVQKPPDEKTNVYMIPLEDGNRLIKFVDKSGRPVSNELVQHVLPQVRREAYKLPKGLVTMTVNVQATPPPSPQKAPPPPAAAAEGGAGVSVAKVDAPDLSIPVSKFGAEGSGGGGGKAVTKLYNIGSNNYLSIEEGVPYLLKKQEDGSLLKVGIV